MQNSQWSAGGVCDNVPASAFTRSRPSLDHVEPGRRDRLRVNKGIWLAARIEHAPDGDDRYWRSHRHRAVSRQLAGSPYRRPAVLVCYLLGAGIALLLMGTLSEMAVAHPTAGSFGVYAELYLNRW